MRAVELAELAIDGPRRRTVQPMDSHATMVAFSPCRARSAESRRPSATSVETVTVVFTDLVEPRAGEDRLLRCQVAKEEKEQLSHCTACGHENLAAAKFCGECGQPLAHTCPRCQAPIGRGAKFCTKCGTALQVSGVGSQVAGPDTQQLTPDTYPGERRQLTVLFCDLVGSTELSGRLDPEEWQELVRRYRDATSAVVSRYAGHIAQYLGDGVLVYFGYPAAHDDDAERAVRVGLAVIDAPRTVNDGLVADRQLSVRVGIHTGPVVVSQLGGSAHRETLALGETVNIAALLQGLAAPDTAVASAATQRLVPGIFIVEELGPQKLNGVERIERPRMVPPGAAPHGGGNPDRPLRCCSGGAAGGRGATLGGGWYGRASDERVAGCGRARKGRGAMVEAEQHYRRALAMLATQPDTAARASQELTLQIALFLVATLTHGFGSADTEPIKQRVRELSAQAGDTRQLVLSLVLGWGLQIARGEPRAALVFAEQALEAARADGSDFAFGAYGGRADAIPTR